MKQQPFLTWVLSMICGSAMANTESGIFISGSVGYGYISDRTLKSSTDNSGYSIGADAGYIFDQHFSINANTTFLSDYKSGLVNNYVLSGVAVRASIPFSDFVQVYLEAGPGYLASTNYNVNQYGVFLGGGTLLEINPHMGINVTDYGVYLPYQVQNDVNVFAVGYYYVF